MMLNFQTLWQEGSLAQNKHNRLGEGEQEAGLNTGWNDTVFELGALPVIQRIPVER